MPASHSRSELMSSLNLWAIALVSRVGTILLTVANLALLARVLDPEGSGYYFVFLSLVMVLTVAAGLGMPQSAIVFSGREEKATRSVHSVLLHCVPAQSLMAAIVGVPLLSSVGQILLPNFPREYVWMAFISLPPALYATFWNGMMTGMRRIAWLTSVQLASIALTFALDVVFVALLRGGVPAALSVYLAVMLMQSMGMVMIAQHLTRDATETIPRQELAQEMLRFGLRGYLGSVSSLLWSRSTVFLLNAFHGSASVSIFFIAQQLAERTLLPSIALQDITYQRMAVLPRQAATETMNRYLRTAFWGMLPILAAGALLAPWAIGLIFGDSYAASGGVFRVLLIGSLVMIVAVLIGPYFLAQLRRPGLLSVLAWINMIVNVSLGLLLVPAWREMGAAAALVLTQIFGVSIVLALYLRMANTRLTQMFVLRSEDVTVLAHQAHATLRRRVLAVGR